MRPAAPPVLPAVAEPPAAAAVMSKAAHENFPVASRVLPRRQRAHLMALYGFARLVDDVGDEAPGDRLALLDWLDARRPRRSRGGRAGAQADGVRGGPRPAPARRGGAAGAHAHRTPGAGRGGVRGGRARGAGRDRPSRLRRARPLPAALADPARHRAGPHDRRVPQGPLTWTSAAPTVTASRSPATPRPTSSTASACRP